MWQDFVFMAGSGLSVFFLAPTVRDASAKVPLATSLPSMLIGLVYALTFYSLGMTFSALGAAAAGSMWSLIVVLRSPRPSYSALAERPTRVERAALLYRDFRHWADGLVGRDEDITEQFVFDPKQSHAAFAPADD